MRQIGCILSFLVTFFTASQEHRGLLLDLSGQWQMVLDTKGIAKDPSVFDSALPDSVQLPGTLDTNHKGIRNTDTTTMHLNRLHTFEGSAWYQKKVFVPKSFRKKHLLLFLERTRFTKVWIDGVFLGASQLLQSPQYFEVPELVPGEHTITIQVSNDLKRMPYGNVHIYSDDTQTNWNGILGKIHLEAVPATRITDFQVYPDIDNRKIDMAIVIAEGGRKGKVYIEFRLQKTVNGITTYLKSKRVTTPLSDKMNFSYVFEEDIALWDEFQTPLYTVTAVINDKDRHQKTVSFGMRKFDTSGGKFRVNGRTIFLRGKHEAAVFPVTGYAPMDVDSWRRVYKIAKAYGINHYRFHSYCPPEAAFTAADQEGIYIQAELPFWGGMDSDILADLQQKEAIGMLKAYGNHPSFVLFSPGNEIWSGHERVETYMTEIKALDKRHLYSIGSNNNIGYTPPKPYADFFIGARTPFDGDSPVAHTRLSHSYADAADGGIINSELPSSDRNFDASVSRLDLPVISHEVGQYQIFPDYSEIPKYTGVLKPWNLEIFRKRLERAGMMNQAKSFQKASGAWAALCYKAEMESALRTKDLAGFQLLDLQDFPGQGTALVGILDAFMDSKNVVDAQTWKQSCNSVVILPEFPKYCYTSDETFKAAVFIANYSERSIDDVLLWKLAFKDGRILKQGNLPVTIPNDGLNRIGEIVAGFTSVEAPEELTFTAWLQNSGFSNSYPIWIYPGFPANPVSVNIITTDDLTPEILRKLTGGAKVLYFPKTSDIAKSSIRGQFAPEFWNYGMFKSISESNKKPVSSGTLGLLMDPQHPLFTSFPTGFHTNWQWFPIIKASNSIILDGLPEAYRPVVQVIDNLERNHRLGLIFEFKVGKGKLLVCGSDLRQLKDSPSAMQLFRSTLDYMESGQFQPNQKLNAGDLKKLFGDTGHP